jgi:hypothetical protein
MSELTMPGDEDGVQGEDTTAGDDDRLDEPAESFSPEVMAAIRDAVRLVKAIEVSDVEPSPGAESASW